MCRPPYRPALHCRGTQQSEDELTDARGLEATVRKIAVIETRDGEHAYHIQRDRDEQRDPAEAHPYHGQTGHVPQQEGDDARPVDMPARVWSQRRFTRPSRKVAAAEPARQLSVHDFRRRRLDHDFILWSHQVSCGLCIYIRNDCSAAMRSSSGGWLMNSRMKPLVLPVLIPKACICGGIGSPWLCFNTCNAAIILPAPARSAPPRSARNSRRREYQLTIMLARIPSTICATIVVKKNPIPDSSRSFLNNARSMRLPMIRARNMTNVFSTPCNKARG